MNLLDYFDNTDPESLDIFKNDSGLLWILMQKIVSDPFFANTLDCGIGKVKIGV